MADLQKKVYVRFAPSPTGFLHIGNARAAVVNWLFAHKHQGKFLLRLDDTDLERSEERFATAILEDLAWLGLPHDCYAKQSDRFNRYQEAHDLLVRTGRLYPCYETPEELDFKRKRQLGRGEPPLYDRAALKLTEEEKARFEREGCKPHWRFRLLDQEIHWQDLVRGPVEFQGGRLSDPVLVRADGVPLYTLSSVVDDLDFGITHIIRGEDHVTNTAVQVQLYEALGGDAKNLSFGHFTLFVDAQGQGLSKRLGSLSLAALREEGLEPMAINSLLARLGTSLPLDAFSSLEEILPTFDLATFSRTPPRFDVEELWHLNRKILHHMPFEQARPYLEEKASQITEPLWNLIRGNLTKLSEVPLWQEICFGELPNTPQDGDPEEKDYREKALALLPLEPWTVETWGIWTKAVQQETGRKGKALFMPLRKAITGMEHGPEMKDLLPLIKYETIIKRLKG